MNGSEMATVVPWVLVAFSTLAVVLSAVFRQRETRKAWKELAVGIKQTRELSGEWEGLEYGLRELRRGTSGLREKLTRHESRRAVSSARADEDPDDDDLFVVAPRVKRFIDLVMAWQKESGHKLRGAAITDWMTIETLTIPGTTQQNTAAPDEGAFTAAARRVVEFAVIASGRSAASADEEQIGRLLHEMAAVAGLKLIEPQQGQRPDPQLHEPVSTVVAGRYQPGTIAAVEIRGLVRGNGSVMKAKVHLYD